MLPNLPTTLEYSVLINAYFIVCSLPRKIFAIVNGSSSFTTISCVRRRSSLVTRWRCKRLYYRENCRYCERSLCFNAIIVQIVALYTLFLWLKRRTQQRESRYFWNPIFTIYTNKPHSLVLLDGKAIHERKKIGGFKLNSQIRVDTA